jgi:hypothetical protein
MERKPIPYGGMYQWMVNVEIENRLLLKIFISIRGFQLMHIRKLS